MESPTSDKAVYVNQTGVFSLLRTIQTVGNHLPITGKETQAEGRGPAEDRRVENRSKGAVSAWQSMGAAFASLGTRCCRLSWHIHAEHKAQQVLGCLARPRPQGVGRKVTAFL